MDGFFWCFISVFLVNLVVWFIIIVGLFIMIGLIIFVISVFVNSVVGIIIVGVGIVSFFLVGEVEDFCFIDFSKF